MMFADVATGHVALADFLFLVAEIFGLLGAIAASPKCAKTKIGAWASTLLSAAVTAAASGFLVL